MDNTNAGRIDVVGGSIEVDHTLLNQASTGNIVVPYDLGSSLFDPQLGDSFNLFEADSITGSFNQLLLASLDPGLRWQLDILPDDLGTTDLVRLSVVSSVPVPPAVWLFLSGLPGLAGVARRRAA